MKLQNELTRRKVNKKINKKKDFNKKNTLLIRHLKLKDCKEISKIHSDAFEKKWTKSDFEKFLKNRAFFGLKVKVFQKIIAFILCSNSGNDIEIITFCVLKKLQNCGIGKVLLKNLIYYCKMLKKNAIVLDVSKENVAAYSLYEKLNFYKIGERKNYYEDGKHAIVLLKRL